MIITDVPHYVVSVMRCGVTTNLDWPVHGDRKEIESLFDGLDKITKSIPWQKKSDATEPTWTQ